MSRSGNPAKRAWQPMRSGTPNPILVRHYVEADRQPEGTTHSAWGNDIYDCFASTFPDGSMHLSIKRRDRAAIRDWRHFQQIKNEVAGPEREAVEIFPRESRLTDGANQYHLHVTPPGVDVPFGYANESGPEVSRQGDFETLVPSSLNTGKGRQREWQPGLTTGLGGAS
jgi:hypothetical protein